MKNIYKLFAAIILAVLLGLNHMSAYDLNARDIIILDDFEKKIVTLIDTKESLTPGKIIDIFEQSIAGNKYSQRVKKILGELQERVDIHYIVSKYGVVDGPTPILYSSDFRAQFGGADGKTLNFDDYGEIDAIEHIAPVGTVFQIHEYRGDVIVITTKEYPFSENTELFIHKAFISSKSVEEPLAIEKIRPSKEEILKKLTSIEGADYVRGGNTPEGIPKLLSVFAPNGEISQEMKDQWMLKGVDCSGMIYWASGGTTPRNTSAIVNFGESVDIEGKTLEEIKKEVQPLDIIVRRGHMMVVYDDNHTIESSYQYGEHVDGEDFNGGVRIRTMEESLGEVLAERKPVNNYDDPQYEENSRFVIKRWIEE